MGLEGWPGPQLYLRHLAQNRFYGLSALLEKFYGILKDFRKMS